MGRRKPQQGLSSRIQSLVLCGLMIALMAVSAWITIPIGLVPVTLQTFVMIFALLYLSPRQYLISLVSYILIGAVGLPVFSGMRGGIGVLLSYTGGFLWGFILGALAAFLVMTLLDRFRGRSQRNSAILATADIASNQSGAAKSQTSAAKGSNAFASGSINSQIDSANNQAELVKSSSKMKLWFLRFGRDTLVGLVFLLVVYICGWAQFILVTGLDPLSAFLTSVAPFIVIDVIKMLVAVFMVQTVKQALGLRRNGKEVTN